MATTNSSGATRSRSGTRSTHTSQGRSGTRSNSTRSRSGGRRKRQSHQNTLDYWYGVGILVLILIVLNLFSWFNSEFCDWYTEYVFPLWLNTYGRFTALFPFSFGEVLLMIGIFLAVIALLAWIPMLIVRRRRTAPGVYFGIRSFYRFFLIVVLDVAIVMTLNCFTMYHCTPLDPNPEVATRQYEAEDIGKLFLYIVNTSNELAETFERDEHGDILVNYDKMEDTCIAAMKKLGKRYPKLDGWYPHTKTISKSDLMSQSYTSGVYFPFSLEANVNGIMYIANYPEVICHELSHLRGYIYEDEANFLAFAACMESGDPFLQYSACLGVLGYLSDLVYSNEELALFYDYPPLSELVIHDYCFLKPEAWEKVEEDAIIDTDTVDKVTDTFTDTTLQINGVESGILSYSEVVGLLLEYYDGTLY